MTIERNNVQSLKKSVDEDKKRWDQKMKIVHDREQALILQETDLAERTQTLEIDLEDLEGFI